MAGTEVRCGAFWLSSFGQCGDLGWSSRWPGGCFEASWHLAVDAQTLPPFLRRGSLVEVFAGPRVWQGILTAPEKVDGGWALSATGLYAEGERYHALTSAGVSTSTPDVAIDAAIARGLPWKRRQSFSAVPLVDGDTTDALNTLTALLDAWADEEGRNWGVDADGYVFHDVDPTTPNWMIQPGVLELGVTDGEYASHVYGRYIRDTDGTYQTAVAWDDSAAAAFGRAEALVDLTGLGSITTARAEDIVDGILAKGKARLGWTDSTEPGPWDLLTPGGIPVDFRHVRAGQMARAMGALDPTTSASRAIDIVFGEATYHDSDGGLTIAPVGKEASTLADAIEAATNGSRS